MAFWNKKKPAAGISREQLFDTVILANTKIRVVRDEQGVVTLWVPYAPPPVLARWFPTSGGAERKIELDEVGTFVWDMCDGNTRVRDMMGRLIERYKLNRKEAELSLTTFLRTMVKKGLVAVAVPKGRKS